MRHDTYLNRVERTDYVHTGLLPRRCSLKKYFVNKII